MGKKIKIIGIIPARLKSTRLQEKMLLEIRNKPLVYYTYEQVKKSKIDEVIIAVDHKKSFNRLKEFDCRVIMTSGKHKSGTDRIGEVAGKYHADYYINIQGDEPLIRPDVINKMIDYVHSHKQTEILTIGEMIRNEDDVYNPDVVKVVFNKAGYALFFSRNPIPYDRDRSKKVQYIRHIGIYCYRKDVLQKIIKLLPSGLEKAEKLEQLRFLENGFKINILISRSDTIGVDTQDDFFKVKKIIEERS